ncbi:YlmH family RNA-binding protein [Halalkalibacter okhensis]|uniref:RNA-binding protein S4 n=1 Tax=Halalkalibacter okhensis TaxID=333138 RepID=A0A0B0IEJ7_9BACI|nr:RNA-binding protein [Halalkalibacter okhensis]KHF38101.1 RNA-binding protein S4 [Halalkalibacter okhensis]
MSIYQHFREEERPFVEQVLEWQEDVKYRHFDRLTDFLDPRQQEIVRSIIGHDEDVSLSFSGGSRYAERCRLRLTPPYLETNEGDFHLTLFAVEYPTKFVTLEHRDILGAFMNVGIKRDKFGDIFISEDGVAQIVIALEIADYVEMNIQKVGKATVRLNRIPLSEHIKPKDEWVEEVTTASSMRLDVILAKMYKLSRSKVTPFIEKGLVKVNWKTVDRADFTLEVGDYISVRGFGRSKVIGIDGLTKKEKYRLRFGRKQ